MEVKIEFNKKKCRVLAYDNNLLIGECIFIENQDVWNIVHTEVNKEYQGHGIARKLVEAVVFNAKENNKRIVADCSYARKILNENKENI